MTTVSEMQTAIDKSLVNMDRLDDIVNGDATVTVTTDGGPVKSFAKLQADLYQQTVDGLAGASVSTILGLSSALATKADIAFSHSTSYPAGSLAAKLKRTVSPFDAPFNATGVGDDTAAVQAAIDYCVANYPNVKLDLTGQFNVSSLTIGGGNGLNISGSGVLNANSSSAQTHLLRVMMPQVMVEGFLKLNVGYRANYECGLWIYATNSVTPQWSGFANTMVNGAPIGYRVGNVAFPVGLASEITMTNIGTYGCPVALEAVGTETYLSLVGCQLSADAFGGDAAWQARPKRTIRSIGAEVQQTGGEVLLTTTSHDYLLEIQPLTSTKPEVGTVCGGIRIAAAFIETGSPLAITTNPNGLTVTPTTRRSGLIHITNCRGYHSQDLYPFVTTDSTFRGEVHCFGNELFYEGGTRTQFNVQCGSANTHVYMDEAGWGNGFYPAHSGVGGGVLHFKRKTLINYQNPNSQSFPVGTTDVRFITGNGADSARWEQNYNTSTGEWTCQDPLTNMHVSAQVAFTAPATGVISVLDNGTVVASAGFSGQSFASVQWNAMNFAAGRKIKIQVTISGSTATANASGFLSYLSIEGMAQ